VNRTRQILRRTALAIGPALLGLAATSSAAVAPASVTLGAVPSLAAGATSLGTLAATTPLALTVVLAPHDPAGLAALATAVSTPGSANYHDYLSVAEFAGRFGASAAQIAVVRAALRSDGLTSGAVAPDGLSITASGSAARASQAFDVSLHRYRERDGRQVYANTAAPRVPAALGAMVRGVLGLDDLPAAAPADLNRDTAKIIAHAASAPLFGSGGVTPCMAATNNTGPSGPYTVNQIAGAYGMDGLYANGDFGAGVTVALYELEPYTANDVAQFQSCFGTSATITAVPVDGGPGSPSGSNPGLETALDIDNVIGTAPSSSVDVYQGPNTSMGVYDTFQNIINANTAKVVSDSWGLCESSSLMDDPNALSAENTLFEQAATQGQSIFVAAGDAGSEGCDGSSLLAVHDAASQPFVTGVGGTTLTTLGAPIGESVWNDGTDGAGGGGISKFWAMPSYQTRLGVNSLSSGSLCGAPSGSFCREVPDVSADAAPSTGYRIYYGALGGWGTVGGTSAATPLWAGLTALADASGLGGCSGGSPLGFLNPALYTIAATTSGANALNDVLNGGNNNPSGSGDYPAVPGYDMATGLGTPIATDGASPGLVAQLCGPSETITAPGAGATYTQTQSVPAAYSCVSPTPGTPTCGGSLPSGGPIDTATTGQHSFTVTATDSIGTTTQRTVVYTVVPPPAATITVPANGGAYTEGQALSVTYGCTASTSGAPSCAGTLPSGSPLDTATPGAHSFSVTATDANGVATTATASYTIVAPPRVTITLPANGAIYALGRHTRASFGCVASAPLTVTRCTSSIADGTAIPTSSLGPHSLTITAVDSNGIATVRTVRYTVVAVHPTISRLRESTAIWLEHHSARSGLAVGTRFSFSLDQPATLTFNFMRTQTGRVAAGRCAAATAANSRARSCTRQLPAGRLTLKAHAGTDVLAFGGTTSSGALAPGSYTALVSAVGVGGQRSAVQSLRFVVASPTGP
jgi:hypothetical protein